VAHRYREKYAFLGNPARILADTNIDYISILSRGGLLYPSDQLLEVAYVMESEFNAFHGDSLRKEKFIFKTLAENVKKKFDKIPFEVLLCLARTRTYIRLRNLNKAIFQKSLERNKKKKMYKMSNKRPVTK
jgi:UDP-2,3-diacylglucosamine pyrophosphatase LpxH